MTAPYAAEPPIDDIKRLTGPAVLDFGTNWCGFCKAAESVIEQAFAGHTGTRHIKVEDGKGRPLGRSYRVTLWPTLVFLRDGKEVTRVVRPQSSQEVTDGLDAISRTA
jgi:thioredoxin 1